MGAIKKANGGAQPLKAQQPQQQQGHLKEAPTSDKTAGDDKTRRSCLHKQLRKTKFCMYHLQGVCHFGADCAFAHTCCELQGAPDLRKTRLCKQYSTGSCTIPDCSFAHSEEELRSTDMFYKKTLCIWYEKGRCRNGDQCRFAHGLGELRARMLPAPSAAAVHSGRGGAAGVPSGHVRLESAGSVPGRRRDRDSELDFAGSAGGAPHVDYTAALAGASSYEGHRSPDNGALRHRGGYCGSVAGGGGLDTRLEPMFVQPLPLPMPTVQENLPFTAQSPVGPSVEQLGHIERQLDLLQLVATAAAAVAASAQHAVHVEQLHAQQPALSQTHLQRHYAPQQSLMPHLPAGSALGSGALGLGAFGYAGGAGAASGAASTPGLGFGVSDGGSTFANGGVPKMMSLSEAAAAANLLVAANNTASAGDLPAHMQGDMMSSISQSIIGLSLQLNRCERQLQQRNTVNQSQSSNDINVMSEMVRNQAAMFGKNGVPLPSSYNGAPLMSPSASFAATSATGMAAGDSGVSRGHTGLGNFLSQQGGSPYNSSSFQLMS